MLLCAGRLCCLSRAVCLACVRILSNSMLSERQKTERRAAQPAQAAVEGRRGELQDKVKSICRASFLLSLFHVDHDVLTLSPLANRDVSCFFLYYSSKYFTGQA